MDSLQKRLFKDSIKGTTLFGGLQIYKILINVVKTKMVAILIGPVGMGIYGLLSSTIELISSVSGFGLEVSSIRNIAEANATNDINRISSVATTLKFLVWITGIVGCILCLLFSRYLSLWTFGNEQYSSAYIYLSVSLLFMQLTIGQNVLMQGMQRYSYLAKANILGGGCGLLICIPLYYLEGVDAIVPVLITSSLIALFFSTFYSSKIKIKKRAISMAEFKHNGMSMLKLGFFISLQSQLSTLATYFIRIFISNRGGVDEVGLYTAGFQMVSGYIGLIFAAMAKDYYPRLSGIAHDDEKAHTMINSQIVLLSLLLPPVITSFILFSHQMVLLLYSESFLGMTNMVYWAVIGVYFRGLSFPLAYYILARGDSRSYFFNELIATVILLLLNISGYYLWGLTGLGISYIVSNIIYEIQLVTLCKLKYKFITEFRKLSFLFAQFSLSIIMLIVIHLNNRNAMWSLGVAIMIISIVITLKELNRMINIIDIVKSKINHKS